MTLSYRLIDPWIMQTSWQNNLDIGKNTPSIHRLTGEPKLQKKRPALATGNGLLKKSHLVVVTGN